MSKAFGIKQLRRVVGHRSLMSLGCVILLLLAVVPAWGGTFSPGRMVYVNGQLHRFWIDNPSGSSSLYIYHQAGLPADPVNGTGDFVGIKDASGTTIPADRGPYICRSKTTASNEGLAVFNNKIFIVYTKDSSCGNQGSMAAYVATFDLLGTSQYPHGRWTVTDYYLGKVGYNSASAAAITVFNGQLYAFTDTDTYTSADGVTWTPQNHPLFNTSQQPLDAVTIYPHDAAPQILLVYGGEACSSCNYFSYVYGATWDGDVNSPRRDYAGTCANAPPGSGCISGNPIVGYGTSHPNFDGRVSLLPGTKSASTFSSSLPGDKVLAVQMFVQSLNISTLNRWARNLEYHVDDGNWYKKDRDYTCSGLMVYPWFVTACDNSSSSTLINQARHQRFVALGCGSPIPSFESDYLVPENRDTITGCDAADGVQNATYPSSETTRKYWSLVGVVLGSPPFSLNNTTAPAEVKNISNVEYGTGVKGGSSHSQQWTHQNMISTGVEVHGGLFDEFLKINDSFDITFKHDWEQSHETKTETTVASSTTMGTDAYSEGIFQPVPYSTCQANADCLQYKDVYAEDAAPVCRIYIADPDNPYWRLCANRDTSCVCTVTPTGKTGWALFNAPNLFVQDYLVHAYDYNFHDGTGTDLNQDLHTIMAKGFSIVPITFDLQHPETAEQIKNPDGTIKPDSGLLVGMKPFPYSTNFAAWNAQDWDRVDQRWRIKLGPSTVPNISAITHNRNANSCTPPCQFIETQETVNASGETSSNEIRNDTGVEVGTGLLGFKANLTVGNDSSFSTSVTTSTSFETDFQAQMGMPDCTPGLTGCVTQLTSQPYLLVATGKAPWIPDLYPVADGVDGPWAMTWTVTNWCPGGPSCGASPVPVSAVSLPPQNASGRIVGGNGAGEQGGDRYSRYSIQGGRLAWLDTQGKLQRIPMTADEFDPSKGATIEANGMSWSLSGNGSWKRAGNTWTFRTDPNLKQDQITLKLDFGSASYDLQMTKVDLTGHVFAGMTDVVLRLGVNGKYGFSTTLHHDVDISWQWNQPPADDTAMHVTSFVGRYNNATGSGQMSMAGTLPKNLRVFGDVGIVINGDERVIPLIALADFQQAVQNGGVIKYVKEGLIVNVDFGNKTWSATFNKGAMSRLLAPRWGKVSAKIVVGGLPWLNRDHAIADYSVDLKLRR